MKKKLLTMLALLANVVLAAVAQDTPAITFEAGAVERTITVGVAAAGTIKVDWGDGTLVSKEATTAYDLKWDENGVEFVDFANPQAESLGRSQVNLPDNIDGDIKFMMKKYV